MKRIILLIAVLAAAVWAGMAWFSGQQPAPLSDDTIRLDEPLPGATVASPLTIRGRARGTWYFEASFPVILKDQQGSILAQVPAQAQSDWMTADWVPFEATVTFTTNARSGTLTLRKDNPSGLPQYDDSREITVYFQ